MGKTRIILTTLFVLALSSGVVAGMLVSRWPSLSGSQSTTQAAPAARTPLQAELDLSPAQCDQMKGIWEGVRDTVDDCFERAQDEQKKRDNAILALLTEGQKAKLAVSQKQYDDAIAVLKKQRDGAFQEAVQRTEKILNEQQKQRYQELLKSRLGHGAPDYFGPGPASLPTLEH